MNLTGALDADAIHATLADLISINSVNPHFSGGAGERELADYIVQFFHKNHISYEIQPVCQGRPNVVAKLEGRPGGRTIILEAHMDTATELGMRIPPFQPRREGNRIYGRGSCDTKGGLAAMMHAIKALAEATQRPPNSAVLVATMDEEHLFRGIGKFTENGFQADGAIVAEPTSLEIVVASKGILRWRFTTRGRTAHSSKPHLGVNAISTMAKVIVALDERFASIHRASHHPLLGFPTLNVGIIRGGNQVNQVPDVCAVDVDRRWTPYETREEVINEFKELLDQLRERDPEIEIEIEPPYFESYPLESAHDTRIICTVARVAKEVWGQASLVGAPYGSDATNLSRAGIPTVILGPGSIDEAHGAEEYVNLDEVAAAAEIYARTVLEF